MQNSSIPEIKMEVIFPKLSSNPSAEIFLGLKSRNHLSRREGSGLQINRYQA